MDTPSGRPIDFLRTKPRAAGSVKGIQRDWTARPGIGYRLVIPDLQVRFDVTHLRSKFDELNALLTVRALYRGALTVSDHILSSADFNLTQLRSRQDRAKHLRERGQADEIDWLGLLEELCIRVLEAEDADSPTIPLSQIKSDEQAVELNAGGLPLLRRHPTIWFGDGGSAKSYLALYAAIDLAQAGERVLYCDWEFSGQDHADRLRRILGPGPALTNELFYRRCQKPLVRESTRIRATVLELGISFLICDSIGFACHRTPEEAESATTYFSALRDIGEIGSLHLAHVSKAEQGDQAPFGSVFWKNGARSCWYVKRTDADARDDFSVALYHRKANIGRLQPERGMRLSFDQTRTEIAPCDVSQPELTGKMPLWRRMQAALENGPMTAMLLGEELGVPANSIRVAAKRSSAFDRQLNDQGETVLKLVT